MEIDIKLLRYILEEAVKINGKSICCWTLANYIYKKWERKYGLEEINYTIEQIIREKDIQFLQIPRKPVYGSNDELLSARVVGITFEGRQVLKFLQEDTIWNRIKEIGKISITEMLKLFGTIGMTLTTNSSTASGAIDNIRKFFG